MTPIERIGASGARLRACLSGRQAETPHFRLHVVSADRSASIEKNVNRKIVTRYKRWRLLFLDIPSRFPDIGAGAERVVL